ncbi:putative carotenoid cleavage dioxygenase 4, chloroplastic [Silene latifolia]|uniref:putative carotenoid cleavage dioxygenase 4, chloroplastic n=1 Tax=Silene latifolia TaxID=37657 RepID=UPI003D78AE05
MDALSSVFLSSTSPQKISQILIKGLPSSPPINNIPATVEPKPPVSRYPSHLSTVPCTLQKPSSKSIYPQPSNSSAYALKTLAKSTRSSKKIVSISMYKTPQQPEPSNPSLSSAILNTLEDIINRCIDPPRCSSVDPRLVLSQNFAPVDELPPTECEVVEGALPSCLDGAYIRNGPNPQFLPRGPYHLFDGNGMLHSIRISDGKATLCSRYVKTYKYMIEHKAGTSIIPNVFSGCNGLLGFAARATLAAARIIAGQYHPSNGIGLANTSLALFGGRLYALGESDLPYEVRLTPSGDIQTVGRNDFDGKLVMNMTAHPKTDQDTGETFAFRYGPISPFLTYFRFDPKGNKQADVPIFSMTRPSFLHDFAITKSYAVFPDIQILMDLGKMILKGGSLVSWDPSKLSKIGVIPRYAGDEEEIRWFEVPGLNIVHVINAWDEVNGDGNEAIVMVASNIMSPEHTLERMDLIHVLVEKIKIDLMTGVVSRQPLSARNLDFGVLNPAYLGKKNKYVYAGVGDQMPKIKGVVKLDVSMAQDQQESVVASRMFGPGCNGGEPFFVASDPDNADADEDEGYVISYVHDENTGVSKFIVMDAKSPSLDIVASVKLPQRVPYGFHGLFVRDKDLKKL